jgi:hypothetical protein
MKSALRRLSRAERSGLRTGAEAQALAANPDLTGVGNRCGVRTETRRTLFVAKDRLLKSWLELQNRYHAARTRRVSVALIAPPSGEVATQFQSDSSPADSPVRILHAQPGSPISAGYVRFAEIHAHEPDAWSAATSRRGQPSSGLASPVRSDRHANGVKNFADG